MSCLLGISDLCSIEYCGEGLEERVPSKTTYNLIKHLSSDSTLLDIKIGEGAIGRFPRLQSFLGVWSRNEKEDNGEASIIRIRTVVIQLIWTSFPGICQPYT